MEIQITLENTDSPYHPRVIRTMIFDGPKMVHSCDICLACIFARTIHGDVELILRETFTTGKGTIHVEKNETSESGPLADLQSHG